jgi:hypothetical protein
MSRPVRVTVSSASSSAVIPLSLNADPFNVGFGCSVSAGGTLTYTVQHTFDDVYSPSFNASTATWYSNATVVSQTTSRDGNYAFPVTAVRITVTAYTSGSVTFTVIQAGY